MRSIEWRNDYLILTAIVLVALLVVFLPGWMPVQAASEETPLCEAAGTAEGQTLYTCDVGVLCVWDPSPTLGAGVLDCDW